MCDTLVALGSCTKSGNLIFAKNSDRPLSEAQPLIKFAGGSHGKNKKLKCTYIEIDQVEQTFEVIGSKPHWIWGFEHGMNEHGVVIGNEAEWSREKEETENGLLGMDLVRLALERGKTAYEAMDVIRKLLEKYGQGGNASNRGDFRYHNAFLIADKNEAWLLETVNRHWIAKKVKDVLAISNCYSIETDWDEISPELISNAVKKGYTSADVPFNFARSYTAMNLRLTNSFCRLKRGNKLLQQNKGSITKETMKTILRDHYEGELIEPRWSAADGMFISICMHGVDENSSRTAASCVAELNGKKSAYWQSFSVPCLSVFAPVYVQADIPAEYSLAEGTYNAQSPWWSVERFTYEVETNYPKYSPWVRDLRIKLESRFEQEAADLEKKCETLPCSESKELLRRFSQDCALTVKKEFSALVEKIGQDRQKNPSDQVQRLFHIETAMARGGITR